MNSYLKSLRDRYLRAWVKGRYETETAVPSDDEIDHLDTALQALEARHITSDEEFLNFALIATGELAEEIEAVLWVVPVRHSRLVIEHWIRQGKYLLVQLLYRQTGRVSLEIPFEAVERGGGNAADAAWCLTSWCDRQDFERIKILIMNRKTTFEIRCILADYFAKLVWQDFTAFSTCLGAIAEACDSLADCSERIRLATRFVQNIRRIDSDHIREDDLVSYLGQTLDSEIASRVAKEAIHRFSIVARMTSLERSRMGLGNEIANLVREWPRPFTDEEFALGYQIP